MAGEEGPEPGQPENTVVQYLPDDFNVFRIAEGSA